jgi:hypothetical protein
MKPEMNIVWTYWEDRPGFPTPAHILLCRDVLQHQCPSCDIRLVTPANVHDFLPELDPRVWHITLENPHHNPIAVRCAFIRAFLLERHGGLYVDADCIALKDYGEAFRAADGAEFFAMRRTSAPSNHISIAFYGSQANGQVITAYAKALRQRIQQNTHFRWAEVGAHLITPIVDQHLGLVHLFPEAQIHPIVAEQQHQLANDLAIEDVIAPEAYCLMLFHRAFEQEVESTPLAQASVHDLYRGPGLISKVLRLVFPERSFKRRFGRRRAAEQSAVLQPAPHIATRYETDKLIERIGYWVPPGEFEPEGKITPKTKLRIAAVVEERLYQGLRYEAHLLLLTQNNWKSTLQYSKPDFLLMESIWTTATGHWHLGQCPPAPDRNTLLGMIALARQKGIPAVFWFTKGHAYHEHYKHFVRHFDFVFCADPVEVEKLRNEGLQAELLLPCAQPDFYKRQSVNAAAVATQPIPILYDGWADLDKMTADLAIFLKLKPHGLRIIESCYQVFSRRRDILPDYKGHILGCVSPKGRIAAINNAKCYVTHHKTLSSKTTQQWMSLDAIAAGLPVIHFGEINADDPRKGMVVETKDTESLINLSINNYAENDRVKGKKSNIGLTTHDQYTFEHRLNSLLTDTGITL